MANFVELLKRSTLTYKLSLILAFPVILVFMIGFSTTYWVHLETIHTGLWRSCYTIRYEYYSKSVCPSLVDTIVTDVPNKLVIAQVVECLGLIALFTTVLCLAAQLLAPKLNKLVQILGILAPLVAGISILTGACLYATVFHVRGLSYSFFLVILAGCGCIPLFILGIKNKIRSPPSDEVISACAHQQGISSAPTGRNIHKQGYVISPPPLPSEIQPIAGQHQYHHQYPGEKDTSQYQQPGYQGLLQQEQQQQQQQQKPIETQQW